MMNKHLFELDILGQINWLSRMIITNSIIYYYMDNNVIDDKLYDEYARYLGKLIKENPKLAEQNQYYYVMKDYTPDTGFDLYDRLNDADKEYLKKIAIQVLNSYKETQKENNNIKKEKGEKRMKVLNIKDLEKFFTVVDECEGKVELVSSEGDIINLKSSLSKYFSIAKLLSNNEVVKELELRTHSNRDAEKFIKFMGDDK